MSISPLILCPIMNITCHSITISWMLAFCMGLGGSVCQSTVHCCTQSECKRDNVMCKPLLVTSQMRIKGNKWHIKPGNHSSATEHRPPKGRLTQSSEVSTFQERLSKPEPPEEEPMEPSPVLLPCWSLIMDVSTVQTPLIALGAVLGDLSILFHGCLREFSCWRRIFVPESSITRVAKAAACCISSGQIDTVITITWTKTKSVLFQFLTFFQWCGVG